MSVASNALSGFSSINMSTLLSTVYQSSSTANQSSLATNPLSAANARVASEIASTNVRLSAYSKIQSSLVSMQPAAATLSGLTGASTTAAAVSAVQAFAASYNSAVTSTQSSVSAKGSLVNDVRAQAVSRDLKSVVGSTSAANLSAVGISVNASTGNLTVDTVALQKAMAANPSGTTAVLSKIGAQGAQVAGKELATAGNVGSSVVSLSKQSASLSAQLALQQNYSSTSQSLNGSIISAYQSVGLM
jgi:flagellar capping protein FliD